MSLRNVSTSHTGARRVDDRAVLLIGILLQIVTMLEPVVLHLKKVD